MKDVYRSHRFVLAGCLVALAAGGCKKAAKSTHPAPIAPATDALWALAPAGTTLGVVVAPGTVPLLDAALAEVERSVERWPNVKAELAELRARALPEVFDPAARSRVGLDVARGVALFMNTPGELALVLPVVDRAAFRQRAGGAVEDAGGVATDVGVMGGFRCRDVAGHYACAPTDEMLAAMGQSDALARRIASRPPGLRGAIEVEVDVAGMGPAASEDVVGIFSGRTMVRAAVQLARGALTVRAHTDGTFTDLDVEAAAQADGTLARRLLEARPSGFARVSHPALLQSVAGMVALAGMGMGIAFDTEALEELTGEVVLAGAGGDLFDVSVQLGARNGKRLQPLVVQLCQAAGNAGLPVPVRMEGERCMLRVEPEVAVQLGASPGETFERAVEIGVGTSDVALELRVTVGGQGAPAGADLSPLGRELLAEPWQAAVWGHGMALRGFRYAPRLFPAVMQRMRADEGKEFATGMTAALWFLAQVAELGVGLSARPDGTHAVLHVGTHWANPPEVVREFHELLDRLFAGGEVDADLAALARRHPRTALGRSYQNGPNGMLSVAMIAGMAAGVGIPAFMQYIEQARAGDAEASLVPDSAPSVRAGR
jgi:hypothetical protein